VTRTAPVAPARTAADLALDPVRSALLRAARSDADAVVADAVRDAAAVLAGARSRAAAVLAAAAAEGRADAASRAARERARARRDRRTAELTAWSAAREELRAHVRAVVRELPGACPDLRERLVTRIRAELGPDAALTATPDGGLTGEVPGRRLELSLDALADLAVDALGPDVERLWRS
jgi:hypothetical protein